MFGIQVPRLEKRFTSKCVLNLVAASSIHVSGSSATGRGVSSGRKCGEIAAGGVGVAPKKEGTLEETSTLEERGTLVVSTTYSHPPQAGRELNLRSKTSIRGF